MGLFDGLHEALGSREQRVEPPEEFFQTEMAQVDDDLTALWREDGWAKYAGGLFWTLDPRKGAKLLEGWRDVVPQDALVFARSAFGEVFLLAADEVHRLAPQWARVFDHGPSVYVFLNSTIKQEHFLKSTLQRELFDAVRGRVGELTRDECYGLFPAVPLGGNDEDATAYKRVKLREYLALLAQARK